MRIYKTAQGRSSMFLAIKALADSNKKFIITQAFTCAAVPESIIYAGFQPFWLDIELETFSMDIGSFRDAIKKYPDQFGAIFIQHTFGIIPKYYNKLKDLANAKNIPIIEDRCHCNFLENYFFLKNKKNNEKIAYCFSFENAKPINLGRGGILLTSNFSDLEKINVKKNLKDFKQQSLLKSLLHICISLSYNFFYRTIFYWPILSLYRRLTLLGLMPSNFNKFLDDFSCEKIGIFQDKILSFLVFLVELKLKYKKNILYRLFSKLILKNFFNNSKRFPIFVKDKEKAINICKSRFIPVKDYFNTPIQPLNLEEYSLVNYKNHLCLKAEEASRHIISFDSYPSRFLLDKLKN